MKRMTRNKKAKLVSRLKNGKEKHSDLARMFGISRQRVHQIAAKSNARMRKEIIKETRAKVASFIADHPDMPYAEVRRRFSVPQSLVSSALNLRLLLERDL